MTDDGLATIQLLDDSTAAGTVVFADGDHGTLTFAQRHCLTRLLKADYLWAQNRNDADDWTTLLAHTDLIRGRLNDMFLDLVIDSDRGIAYKVQVRAGDHPILLRDSAYSREATILLVFLRQRYDSERRAGSDQVYVDRDECRDHVVLFRPENSTDEAGDRNKVDVAIKFLVESNVLRRAGDDDRFAVLPIIESILPVDRLHALLAWLIEQNSPGAVETTGTPADSDPDTAAEEALE